MLSERKMLLLVFCVFYCSFCRTNVAAKDHEINFFIEEVQSLSQLPMERLIQIKSSLIDEKMTEENIEGRSGTSALALPLKRMSNKKIIRSRHGDYWDEKGTKDTKISKIFQLAITALSFLAFGGYLLTLIIAAIRRNNNNANGNVIVLQSLPNLQNLQKYQRPKRRAKWIIDPLENDFESDRIYQGMILLSQGYAMYNNHSENNI